MFARLLVLLVMAGPAKIAKAEGLCGIFAVAEGARIFGEPPLFDELVSARFVGVEGSTIPQLVDAAGYCGLKAYPISNVGIDFIRNVPAPTILHVRSDVAFGPYTHWAFSKSLSLSGNGAWLPVGGWYPRDSCRLFHAVGTAYGWNFGCGLFDAKMAVGLCGLDFFTLYCRATSGLGSWSAYFLRLFCRR